MKDDKILFDKLELSGIVERLQNSDDWKVIDEIRKRSIDRWIDYLIFKVKAGDTAEFERVRAIIRVWKYDLFNAFKIIDQEGELAFEELKYNDLLRKPEADTQASES